MLETNISNTRSVKFKKSTILLIICQAGGVGISFFLVRLILKHLGIVDYGIWITLVGIVEWFNFFDIGLGHGLRNKFAETKARDEIAEMKKYVSTTFFMMILISLSIFVIFNIAAIWINWSVVLNVPQNLDHTIKTVVTILVSVFCIRFVTNIVSVLLTADQNPSVPALITLSGNVLCLISSYVLIQFNVTSLMSFSIALSVSQIIPLIFAFIYYFSRRYYDIIPNWKYFSKSHLNEIFSFGSKFFLIQITALLMFQSNNIIIAHVCGLEDVTKFNITFKYLNVLSIFFMALLTPLWSATTDAYYKNDIKWIKSTFGKLERIWVLLVFGGIVMIVLSPFVFKLWLGDEFEPDYFLMIAVMLNIVFLMRSTLFRNLMNGVGKIRLQFVVTSIQSLLHIPLAIIIGTYFGVVGVVYTMFLWNFINSIWERMQFNKIVFRTATGIWNK